jgi:hypothetical protein
MSAPHTIGQAEIGRMIEIAAQLGPWTMPVLDALRAGQITLALLRRDQRAPLDTMRRSALPVLAWIGDDDELSCGPDGWRPALPAAHWARAAMIHAAGGEAHHYAHLAAGTILTGRMLLVETSSRHAAAWQTLLAGKSVLTILPCGGSHPIASAETRH